MSASPVPPPESPAAHGVAPRWRMSTDPDEPLFPDASPSRRGYCPCVELEDGRPVGFVPDVDCPDHGEVGKDENYASYGTWRPHGQHIYVPDRTDQRPTAFVVADPWPCAQCDPDDVARVFADDAAYEEAAMRELGFPL